MITGPSVPAGVVAPSNPSPAPVVATVNPPKPKPYRFQIWVWEVAHGATQFGCRMLMHETCAGQVEFDSWAEVGKWADSAISVDGQKVSRIVNLSDMRSTGAFYDYIGNQHKAGIHDHPYYPAPYPTEATARPDQP